MKSSKKKSETQKTTKPSGVLEKFEKQDLGDSLRAFRNEGRWVKPKAKPTPILLPARTIEALREKASRIGIGYQTLLKRIVQEHLNDY